MKILHDKDGSKTIVPSKGSDFIGYTSTQAFKYIPKTIVFDIDGIICTYNINRPYIEAQPLPENIALINTLYEHGHRIVLNTARGRNSKGGFNFKKLIRKQLAEWGVLYHILYFDKPAGHYYVDDRNASTDNLRNLLYMGEL